MTRHYRHFGWLLLLTVFLHDSTNPMTASATENDDVQSLFENGHGKSFGSGNPSDHVKIVDGFPSPREFFTKYVLNNTEPILMKGAVKHTRAYKLWSDEYFKALDIPLDHTVSVESKKKENRTIPAVEMHFKSFVEVYQHTDQYMVDIVPKFLRQDVMVPGVLQCDQLRNDAMVAFMMWFSNGGTSSVVHTDSVENINCLIAGKKDFVIVPPEYSNFVDINHPEGAYSDLDVDAVDYNKFPGIAKVEKYLHANLETGDCLYIPYLWIHQVRSTNRNIAVNVWWDTAVNTQLNLDACPDKIDLCMTLDRAVMQGFEMMDSSPRVIRDHITAAIRRQPRNFDEFAELGFYGPDQSEEFLAHKRFTDFLAILKEIFKNLDTDENDILDSQDMEAATEDNWLAVSQNTQELLSLMNEIFPATDDEEIHDEL